jgi:hypothetical protein
VQGDKIIYELGNGIEIHVTRNGKVLHVILDHPPEEFDITESTLGQLLLREHGRAAGPIPPPSTLRH